ncbi:unnamed protein product [Gadus morhua 'NCC']
MSRAVGMQIPHLTQDPGSRRSSDTQPPSLGATASGSPPRNGCWREPKRSWYAAGRGTQGGRPLGRDQGPRLSQRFRGNVK